MSERLRNNEQTGYLYGKSDEEIAAAKSDYVERFDKVAADREPDWYAGELAEGMLEFGYRPPDEFVSDDLIELNNILYELGEFYASAEDSQECDEVYQTFSKRIEVAAQGLFYHQSENTDTTFVTWRRDGHDIPIDQLSNIDLLILAGTISSASAELPKGVQMDDLSKRGLAIGYFHIAEIKMLADKQIEWPEPHSISLPKFC